MSTKRKSLFAILSLILAALLFSGAWAQSLPDVVRKQRAEKGPPAKSNRVYTNDNLPRAGGLSTPGAESKAESEPAEGAGKPTGESLAPFVPSPEVVVMKMLQVAEVGPGDTVYDLGCGDGRIVILAAQKFGAKAVGVELDEKIYKQALERVKELKLQDKVKIIHGDAMKVDLSPATIVTLYLLPSSNEKLKPNLEKYLKKGARVVSHDFEMPGWEATLVENVAEDQFRQHIIYLYRR